MNSLKKSAWIAFTMAEMASDQMYGVPRGIESKQITGRGNETKPVLNTNPKRKGFGERRLSRKQRKLLNKQ